MEKRFYVYILATELNAVLYVGITNDLVLRITQHRERQVPGFTKRYNVTKLVYFEEYEDASQAIEREKQLKAGSRARKVALVDGANPGWRDLYSEIVTR